jgi:multidrug efflux system membrane fusion protein
MTMNVTRKTRVFGIVVLAVFTALVLPVKQGNVINANTTDLVTINQVTPIYVTFGAPEGRLADLKKYMARGTLQVTAQPQDSSEGTERGQLTFVDNAVDTATGSIKLKGTFGNADLKLWPGQFVNVALRLTTRPNALVVPSQVVQTGQDGQFLYVVRDDQTAEMRPVTVGPRVDQDMVIEKGLELGAVCKCAEPETADRDKIDQSVF